MLKFPDFISKKKYLVNIVFEILKFEDVMVKDHDPSVLTLGRSKVCDEKGHILYKGKVKRVFDNIFYILILQELPILFYFKCSSNEEIIFSGKVRKISEERNLEAGYSILKEKGIVE